MWVACSLAIIHPVTFSRTVARIPVARHLATRFRWMPRVRVRFLTSTIGDVVMAVIANRMLLCVTVAVIMRARGRAEMLVADIPAVRVGDNDRLQIGGLSLTRMIQQNQTAEKHNGDAKMERHDCVAGFEPQT